MTMLKQTTEAGNDSLVAGSVVMHPEMDVKVP